jgi:nucleolar protein 12
MDVDEEGGESDADVDPAALVHESLQSGGKSKSRSGKQKYVPEDETPEKRDQRTVFVGNLPLAVASKRVRLEFVLARSYIDLTLAVAKTAT